MDVYKFVFYLVSLMFSLILSIRLIVVQIWRMKRDAYNHVILLTYRFLKRRRINLHKLPKHIGIVLTESTICQKSLTRILQYAARYGIQRVTIYDPIGNLTSTMTSSSSPGNLHIINNSKYLSTKFDVYINGQQQQILVNNNNNNNKKKFPVSVVDALPKFEIFLIDYRSGRTAVSRMARRLCKLGQAHLHKPDSDPDSRSMTSPRFKCSPEQLDHHLEIHEHLSSDIDFLLSFGKIPSTIGFPPTTLAITEICYVPGGHVTFNESQFVECLRVFEKRDRRYGK